MRWNLMKAIVSKLVDQVFNLALKTPRLRALLSERLGQTSFDNIKEIQVLDKSLFFCQPNQVCKYRVETFFTKEPETLAWIDKFQPGSVMWDVGANVGLYSIFAAKLKGVRVVAFEPSAFNIECLVRNINLNHLATDIAVVTMPLSAKCGFAELKFSTMEWGGALASFGHDFGWDGKVFCPEVLYSTYGLTLDSLAAVDGVDPPDYLKIDVDGIEHMILKGAVEVLKDCREVLVEVNDAFTEQATEVPELLSEMGYILVEKAHGKLFDDGSAFADSYNQIWINEKKCN